MHFSLVKITKEFKHNGVSTWIGTEATLDKDDDEFEAIKKCKSFINTCFYGEKAGVMEMLSQPPEPYLTDEQLPEIQVNKEWSIESGYLDSIKKCESETDLKSFKFLIGQHPHLKEHYDNKLNELKNK